MRWKMILFIVLLARLVSGCLIVADEGRDRGGHGQREEPGRHEDEGRGGHGQREAPEHHEGERR